MPASGLTYSGQDGRAPSRRAAAYVAGLRPEGASGIGQVKIGSPA